MVQLIILLSLQLFSINLAQNIGRHYVFPGYYPKSSNIHLARRFDIPFGQGGKGGLVISQPRYEISPPEEAFIKIPIGNGKAIKLPKGIYQRTETENEFDNDLQLPDITNPLSFIRRLVNGHTKSKKKNSQTNGVYIPLPFGLKPLNFQLMSQNVDGTGLGGGLGGSSILRPKEPAQNAFLSRLHDSLGAVQGTLVNDVKEEMWRRVRYQCQFGRVQCDRALNNYHIQSKTVTLPPFRGSLQQRVNNGNFGKRLTSNLINVLMPALHNQMEINKYRERSLGTKVGGFENIQETGRSNGVYVSGPGFKPFYVGGYLNNNQNKAANV